MSTEFDEFVHPSHFHMFSSAAREFRCHIVVRRTGPGSLQWVGKRGYTGKRADMKAKTAERDHGPYRLHGLVCSPRIHPAACKTGALGDWEKSKHLITPAEFGDRDYLRGCLTPYVLQMDPRHRHFGCVALVENGLIAPHYVHGDYDLYAILPEAPNPQPAKPGKIPMAVQPPRALGLEQRVLLEAKAPVDHVGPLSFRVANYINMKISDSAPGPANALMVNHGEQVNLPDAHKFEKVLAFMPQAQGNEYARVLRTRQDYEAYCRALR
jgi:hypothetical protein